LMLCRSSLNAMALVGRITTPSPTVFHEGNGMYGGKIWAVNRQEGQLHSDSLKSACEPFIASHSFIAPPSGPQPAQSDALRRNMPGA
jgi:hypothetical protein